MSTRTTVTNRIQGSYSEITTQLYITDCANCGIVFGMPRELEERRRADGKAFYCPNGHTMSWHETETDRMRKARDEAVRRAERYERQRDSALDDAQRQRRRAAAARGQLTKMRNRVARGVCPKAGCQRSFDKLADHVKTCHPELIGEGVLDDG